MSFFDFLEKGGPLMFAVGTVSLVAVTVFLERLYGLARTRVMPPDFTRTLLKLLSQGEHTQAETACLQSDSAISSIAFVALKHRGKSRQDLKEVTNEKGALELSRLERGVGVVGTMATIAPLLGLLGTVTGMIQVFRKIAEETDPQIDVLAGGIWEALVSTGAGLTVAIPCYVAYRYLLARVDKIGNQLEETTIDIIDALDQNRAS
ncbi:MAG: biopolymer transport protein ExbB [Myxococcota bacterium]